MKTYLQAAFTLLLLSIALVACPGTSGSTAPPNTPPPASPTPPSTPPLTPPTGTGNVPTELVGVWQYLIASSGDYTDTSSGTTFSMTGGYAVQLKLNASGQFYFAQFSSGVSTSCPLVTYFEQMTGVATFQNNQLTLTPSQRRLDITNCTNSGTRTLSNDPVQLGAVISST